MLKSSSGGTNVSGAAPFPDKDSLNEAILLEPVAGNSTAFRPVPRLYAHAFFLHQVLTTGSRKSGRQAMASFKALRIDKADKGTTAAIAQFDEAEFNSLTPDADVTVAVEWSTLNYKDGLAVTGKSPVVRRFPMIAGIDFAGTVTQSSN